jgi:hypothetical protein
MTDKHKIGPTIQTTPSRSFVNDQPRAHKEIKRRIQDHYDTLKEPAPQNTKPSVTIHTAPITSAYVAKNIPHTPNSQTANYGPHKHVPPQQTIPTIDNHLNYSTLKTNPPNHTELDLNNISEAQNRDNKEDDQDDNIITSENHDLQDANEEDMVT